MLLLYYMKTCNKCEHKLDLSAFSYNRSKEDGYNSTCKQCQKAYAKSHYAANRSYYISKATASKKKAYPANLHKVNEHKARHACKYCPESDPCCLDLHHRESADKEYSIANKLGDYSWAALEKEILKCDVVCSNCHRKLHAGHLSVSKVGLEPTEPAF